MNAGGSWEELECQSPKKEGIDSLITAVEKTQMSAVNYNNFRWTTVVGEEGGEWLWLNCFSSG